MDRVDYQSMIVQDLLNDHKDEKLHLNPWYQRRSVWTRSQKSYLINTLFERKPIPALYIRHSIDMERGKSIKEVVDGQQRSRAIIEFVRGDFATKLSARGQRKTFSQLSKAEKEMFLITPIPVGYLIGANDSDVIDIFARINSVSKTLNAQEKRNATFSGEFKQFAVNQAISRLSFWREMNIFSSNDIARMQEVLFVSDLIFNLTNGLSDFRPLDIDRIYRENDDSYPGMDAMVDRLDNIFSVLYDLDKALIKDTIFRRPPLLFSLMMAIDSHSLNTSQVEIAVRDVDAAFHDEDLNDPDVITFRNAVSASLQRITSRQIRDAFIKSRIP